LTLLQTGFLTRGAVVQGNVFHRVNFAYGPALLRAVELEKATKYPRVLFDTESITGMPMWDQQPTTEDTQGLRIVNMSDFPAIGADPASLLSVSFGFPDIVKSLRAGLESTRMNSCHRAKWLYMRDNMVRVLEPFGQAGRPYIEHLREG